MNSKDQRAFVDALGNLGLLASAFGDAAADIAHARRRLFLAYLSEGFTEAQSLELCKTLTL